MRFLRNRLVSLSIPILYIILSRVSIVLFFLFRSPSILIRITALHSFTLYMQAPSVVFIFIAVFPHVFVAFFCKAAPRSLRKRLKWNSFHQNGDFCTQSLHTSGYWPESFILMARSFLKM